MSNTYTQQKAGHLVCLWWLAWCGLASFTYVIIIKKTNVIFESSDIFSIVFLVTACYLFGKMLCVIASKLCSKSILFAYERVVLPLGTIFLPFFWGKTNFATRANKNVLYEININTEHKLILMPLFIEVCWRKLIKVLITKKSIGKAIVLR